MSQVHGNPQEMRNFARALRQFASQLEGEVRRIDGQSRAVGQSWNDAEYRKFMQEWQQATAALKRFLGEVPRYEQHVNRKAEALEQYINSR